LPETRLIESSSIILRPLHIDNCPSVAEIHLRAFPDSALTRMGVEAVCRYYAWQLIGPQDCLAMGAFQGNILVGFIFAGVFRGALSGFISKNLWFLVGRVVTHPWMAFNPIFLDRIRMGLRVLKPRRPMPIVTVLTKSKNGPFGVLAIAVDPDLQKSGIGQLLMQCAEKATIERRYLEMVLTVHPANTHAVRFYEKLGWQKVSRVSEWDGAW
jgi:ribosomal protein S18 acetylase RimI-like enzyme